MKDTTRLRIYIAFDMAGTKEVEVTYKKNDLKNNPLSLAIFLAII